MLAEQLPGLAVEGAADEAMTGNFAVEVLGGGGGGAAEEGALTLSPYGFVDTPARRAALFRELAALEARLLSS